MLVHTVIEGTVEVKRDQNYGIKDCCKIDRGMWKVCRQTGRSFYTSMCTDDKRRKKTTKLKKLFRFYGTHNSHSDTAVTPVKTEVKQYVNNKYFGGINSCCIY